MTQIINLFGGPGAGKSTMAAAIFAELKIRGYSIELVTEYAKDLVWERRYNTLKNQIYVLGKQLHRIIRLTEENKVDIVITDSPIILSGIYYKERSNIPLPREFEDLVIKVFNSFCNINFFVKRNEHIYESKGRLESLDEAIAIDSKIKDFLISNDIPLNYVEGYYKDLHTTCDTIERMLTRSEAS